MQELSLKDQFTSLELTDLINQFREKEGNKKKLRHKDLLNIVRDEFEDEINERKISPVKYKDKKGEERPMYILNLSQAKQVLLRESKQVRRAIIKYIEVLEKKVNELLLEKQTSDWLETRKQGKITRHSETDVIKELITYAKAQGSKNSDKLYMTYSKLANKMAGISKRDMANIMQLNNLSLIENIILNVIRTGMTENKHYKQIYQDSKKALETFNNVAYLQMA